MRHAAAPFFAASFGAPVGETVAVPGGWELTGRWPYASGIAWSTHFMGQTMVPGEEKPMLFVAPRSSWTMLDDWGDSLGLKGSASHSVQFDRGFVDELFCLHDLVMVDIDVDDMSLLARMVLTDDAPWALCSAHPPPKSAGGGAATRPCWDWWRWRWSASWSCSACGS